MNSTCKKSNMLRGIRRKTRGLAFMATAAAFALLHPGVSQAAVITWNTAEDITDASDVYTAGSLEYAVTFGSAVNYGGVAFSAETYTKTLGGAIGETITLTDIDLLNWGRNVFDHSSASTPFAGLDANYQTLLAHMAATDNISSSVRLKGLTIGADYAVQVWLNRSIDANTNVGLIDGNNVDLNTTGAIGGTGQYIVGTFKATDVTQSFTVAYTGTGAGRGGFSALQVRDVTIIPEPSTLVLFGMAALIVTALRRRATLR